MNTFLCVTVKLLYRSTSIWQCNRCTVYVWMCMFPRNHIFDQIWFSTSSAIAYTMDNNNKYMDINQNTGHLVWLYDYTAWTTPSTWTTTLHNKWTIVTVSPQNYTYPNSWFQSHTAKRAYENASFTHSILCSAVFLMRLFPWAFFFLNWIEPSASVEHLNASWMVLDAFGRIIENQCISVQYSLVVRNIWAASFGL